MISRRLISLHRYSKYSINPVFKNSLNPVLRRSMSDMHSTKPGDNLPFSKCIGNPGRLTFFFILFFGSGFWATNLVFIYMMHK